MSDILAGKFDGLGTEREVVERRGRTATELADEMAGVVKASADMLAVFDDAAWAQPSPGAFQGTLGDGVEALWSDAYLHGDDIRFALGQPSVQGPGLRAAVHHIAQVLNTQQWGPATIAVQGVEELPIGGGGGQRIEGDPFLFAMVATGRSDPAKLGLDESVNIYRA
jgi:hypothetical protein